uniref:Integrase catalytic domain-containing protein n=1 Tax=Dracunculus medinensis TaxID=318479 RepID=A0A0N4US11_DRAME
LSLLEVGMAKRWVALFTSFTTRAVHLELADDLSAESFLTALRRFVARRGCPKLILSDNASQFHLVYRMIKKQESQLTSQIPFSLNEKVTTGQAIDMEWKTRVFWFELHLDYSDLVLSGCIAIPL